MLSQEPAETVKTENVVPYPNRDAHASYMRRKWTVRIIFLIILFLAGQTFSFGVHVSMERWESDEIIEDILGENVAYVVRWLGSEGRAWGVFLEESGLKETVYDAVGMVKEEVEDIIDPFNWYDPRTW